MAAIVKIGLINGPNLNLLGTREKNIYGGETFEAFYQRLKERFIGVELSYYQSNVEGELINKMHEIGFHCRFPPILLFTTGPRAGPQLAAMPH